MKLLLDECTPQRLKADFTGHEIFTVSDVGLRGVKNGALLSAAAGNFDALITVDRKMPRQQNVSGLDLALIVLVARPCRYPQLKLLISKVLDALETIKPGEVIEIGSAD
jgi:predicted nuclease of predicted toxin-antitoxin system